MTQPERPRPETVDILRKLVSFDTTSRNSNLALIDWVEDYLTGFGARSERVPNEAGDKASLWASFGPEDVPGWVLSGHTDVVPVDGQDWTSDPYQLRESGERLYGRGACDMKGFLACCLALVPDIAKAPLTVPIHLAFSYDEEIGCIGVRPMLHQMAERRPVPLGCIVGEPTMMNIAIGHKSKRSFKVRFTGTPGHSSRAPDFVNAVEFGANLVVKVQEIGRRFAKGASDPLYDTPHSTAHVGIAHGGEALNIVPESFVTEFEFRTITEDDPDALEAEMREFAFDTLLPQMRAIDPAADISFEIAADTPGVDTAPDAPVTLAAQRFAQKNDVIKVAFGTEAGLFQQIMGVPTVVCGPGSIGVAHKPDEYITLDQLAACEDFLHRLLQECR